MMNRLYWILFMIVLLVDDWCIGEQQHLEKCDAASEYKFVIISFDDQTSDSAIRLKLSAESYNIGHIFLKPIKKSKGDGDAEKASETSYTHMINDLKQHRAESDLIVLVIDGFDAVISGSKENIVCHFLNAVDNQKILFSSQSSTADRNLAIFMGFMPSVFKLLQALETDSDDNQLAYSSIYTNKKYEKDFDVAFDKKNKLFQNADDAEREILLQFEDNGDAYMHNILRNTYPTIAYASQSGYSYFNYLANYVGKAWSADDGCKLCANTEVNLKNIPESSWPSITMGLFIVKPVSFVRDFLDAVANLTYPFSKIDLYVYNNQKYNEDDVNDFLRNAKKVYRSVEYDNNYDELDERKARNLLFQQAMKTSNDFMFILDAEVYLANADSLRLLIETSMNEERDIIAPMVKVDEKYFSNFWGALSKEGYYARSDDYVEIINGQRVGTWNVPHITSAILIGQKKVKAMANGYAYNQNVDPDMSFCEFARSNNYFIFVDNQRYYGFLIDVEGFEANLNQKHPEMYDIFNNRYLWEKRYIHAGYFAALNGIDEIPEPCPDVFHYPLMSKTFTRELIEEMVNNGQWSSGTNEDDRLEGGYENVPTIDIHMKQINFEKSWLLFLDEYVRPMQEKIFIGYYQKVQSSMMFVVRYQVHEQPSLPAHHDASTYTVDIALNKRGVDYEGGGIFYVRYNCTVAADQVGYAAMFPGRLTHLHEGLPITKGIRYIAVSFLNP